MQRLQLRLRFRLIPVILLLTILSQSFVAFGAAAASGGPAVVTLQPADNNPVVPANAQLSVMFDEAISRGTAGTVLIKEVASNNTVGSYDMATDTTRLSIGPNNQLNISPAPGALQAGLDYYVQITPGALIGSSGYFSGITDATAWNFHVVAADTTPPAVSTFAPSSGGTMPATGALTIAFNEPVQAASGSIQIVRRDTQDAQVVSVLSSAVTGSGTNVIRVQPSTRLAASTQYDVLIDNGAFVDAVGNKYEGISGPYIWSFSTTASAVAAPKFIYPQGGGTGVSGDAPITLQLQFQTGMKAGVAGNITVKKIANNETVETIAATSGRLVFNGANVSIPLANALTRNTSYYVLIDPGALLTTGGEAYEGIVDPAGWSFSTQAFADTTRPTVASFAPASGASTTDIAGSLSIQFSEPVVPGSGNVVIRNADTNAVFCSIPVTSTSIAGGGTTTIAIKPCASFSPNVSYAVQIGTMAFADLSGNYFAGISTSDLTTWRFRVASDTTPPELISTDPAPLLNSVRANAVLRMTFSEPVRLASSSVTASAILARDTSVKIPLALAIDGADPRIVTLTPETPFAVASGYVVNVPANAIADLAGNAYPGILNDYRWTFQTIGTDTTAPGLASASMDGAAVVLLTYGEALDESSIPYASNYYVTVNDVPRQVNSILVKGTQVRLTLQSGVAVGQTVKVSYTLGAVTLKDLSGNAAAAFNATNVANTADTTLPRPSSGTVSGNVVTLTFNKTLASVSSSAASQFTVKVNGAAQSVSSISSSGANVTIGLYSTISGSQSVSVSYSPGSYKLTDLSGNDAAGFTDFYVQNANDTTPPVLSGVSVLGTSVVLSYNEGLLSSSVPPKSSFSVLVGGSAAEITGVALSNNTVTLTLFSAVIPNQTVTVTYIPGANPIKDLAGNQASLFTGYSVTASSTAAASLSSISIDGTKLTLQYSGALNSSIIPYVAQYTVKNADGGLFGISNIAVSGSQVVLTLTAPAAAGKAVTVSYSPAGNALKDASGQAVAAFADRAATNQTSAAAGLPEYLSLDGAGGLLLSQTAASKISGTTPSGKTTGRYNLDRDKVTMAFTALGTALNAGTVTAPRVTFSVPQSEPGAILAIPVMALAGAVSQNSSAVLRLDYGDLLFSLPLKAVNFSKEVQASGGDMTSAYLLLKIEKLSNTSLASALNARGVQLNSPAADFTASIEVNGSERAIDEYSTYVTRSFLLPATSASAADAAVVRLDAESGEIVYVPTKAIVSGSTLRVDFMRKSNSVYAVVAKPLMLFSDMTKHWAGPEVGALASKFIVKGSTNSAFAPERKITRAEFAEFIVRGLGLNGSSSSAAKFSDVGSGGAAAAYIGAAAKANIVQGGTDGRFRPSATITREEMATMMLRAMSYVGVMPTVTGAEINAYKDRTSVSSWAKDAVVAAVKTGLIKGVTTTQLKPKDNATRAQAALIVKRFLEYVELM
ncbi:Ig-like domain-containing protein [Cohnella sp. GbtcB17]|uniref:Ig-like domain-containing protein n=1 Tax=Cohnella sp. GbtcB17 TaxID=2824762 RepID=UPI001C30630A|nr:Ig-like domain-containing protein [Cohnella sp. GbtcB17]